MSLIRLAGFFLPLYLQVVCPMLALKLPSGIIFAVTMTTTSSVVHQMTCLPRITFCSHTRTRTVTSFKRGQGTFAVLVQKHLRGGDGGQGAAREHALVTVRMHEAVTTLVVMVARVLMTMPSLLSNKLQIAALVHDVTKLLVAVWGQFRQAPELGPRSDSLDFRFKTVLFPTRKTAIYDGVVTHHSGNGRCDFSVRLDLLVQLLVVVVTLLVLLNSELEILLSLSIVACYSLHLLAGQCCSPLQQANVLPIPANKIMILPHQ